MTKKTIFVDRYGNIRYYLHYKIGKEWSYKKAAPPIRMTLFRITS